MYRTVPVPFVGTGNFINPIVTFHFHTAFLCKSTEGAKAGSDQNVLAPAPNKKASLRAAIGSATLTSDSKNSLTFLRFEVFELTVNPTTTRNKPV